MVFLIALPSGKHKHILCGAAFKSWAVLYPHYIRLGCGNKKHFHFHAGPKQEAVLLVDGHIERHNAILDRRVYVGDRALKG
jgi:hypothetical protein